jgi:hypothetical protein
LLAAVTAGEAWQSRGLSAAGRKLLARVNESPQHAGSGPRNRQRAGNGPRHLQRAGGGPPHGRGGVRASGPIVKEIEIRLLVHAEQVHTELGRHEVVLEPWSAWQRRMRVRPVGSPTSGHSAVTRAALGRQRIEEAIAALGAPLSALPWRAERRGRARRQLG